ncbi:MAG: 50S ribosomal protein L18 [Parcubacteria bacterium 33_209]|nr:MAG: 50S ribosomal protein L18 [Parcubacteria bacterium 33_209]
MIEKKEKRIRRHKRVTSKIGSDKPRLCVFRSNQFIYDQIVSDGKTLVSINDKSLKGKDKKIESSKKIGQLIAQKAIENKIEEVVFDRGGYKYHGRVKALAEGAREGGLKF